MSGNLVRRVGIGLVAVPLILLISYAGGIWNLVFVEIIVLVGISEYLGLTSPRLPLLEQSLVVLLSLFVPLYFYLIGPKAALWPVTITVLGLGLTQLSKPRPEGSLNRISLSVFGVLYVGWTIGHLVLLREVSRGEIEATLGSTGAELLFFLYILTWSVDTAAYAAGRLFGRRPFFKNISPRKTWEGFWAGLAIAPVAAVIVSIYLCPLISPLQAVPIGLALGATGQLGDLVESTLKRDRGLKDTSGIIPGHGGVLDRFDSLLFNAPILYYIVKAFIL